MTNDEMRRAMDFIVEQQAQFRADLQENETQSNKRFAIIEDTMTRLAGATLTLTQRMMELSVAQTQMDSKMANLAESHLRLAESQEHTDQRLSALIDIVRDNMNGRR